MQIDFSLKRLYRPLSFFGIDFLLTWIPLWLLAIGLQSGWFAHGTGLLVLAGSSSSLAAVLFVHRTGNRYFIKDFWIRVVDPFRISPLWWIVILLSQAGINILAIFLSTMSAAAGLFPGNGSLEQLALSPRFLAAPLGFVIFTFLFGPLPEELGWRGYGLDALRSRMNLLKTSIVLALIWGIWHVPMVWIPGSFQNQLLEYPVVLASFFFAFLPSSLLMSWIYYRTGRSTLSAILFHFAANLSGEIFSLSPGTRIIQTVLLTLWAAIVVWKEGPLFTVDEFSLDFNRGPSDGHGAEKRRMKPLGSVLFLPIITLLFFIPGHADGQSSWETVPLPYLFYTSDTGIAGGGVVSIIHTSSSPSSGEATEDLSLCTSGTWSQKNQKEVNISLEKWCFHDRVLWLSDLRCSDFPGEFFGLGPESDDAEPFTSEGLEFEFALLLGGDSSFRLGPVLNLGISDLNEVFSGGELDELGNSRELAGSFPGAGVLLRYDTRDKPRFPTGGSLMELQPLFFLQHGNRENNFIQVTADMRYFFSPLDKITAAFRLSAVLNSGEPPLHEMAELGGLFLMRGFPSGRFIDRNGLAGQCELRFPLFRRLSGVIFGAAGTVSPSLEDLRTDTLKYSGGAGFRFALNSSGDITLRLDFGVTRESNGLYITLMEAF